MEIKIIISRKCIWTYNLEIIGHFVHTSMCLKQNIFVGYIQLHQYIIQQIDTTFLCPVMEQ